MSRSGDWVIIRTQGRHTLRLAETLSEDGYEAWTPVESKTITIPAKNVKRKIKLPIMPSYVFVRAAFLIELIRLSGMKPIPRRMYVRPQDRSDEWRPFHADFSVMHYLDRIPVINDHHLQGLRTLEAKLTPRQKGEPLEPGVSVRVKSEGGSFAGMTGRVERSRDGWTLVAINSGKTVTISTSLLTVDEIQHLAPKMARAA